MSTIKTAATNVVACIGITILGAYAAFGVVCAVAIVFPSVGDNSCVPQTEATVAELYDGNICEE
jgi:hypothetical protein